MAMQYSVCGKFTYKQEITVLVKCLACVFSSETRKLTDFINFAKSDKWSSKHQEKEQADMQRETTIGAYGQHFFGGVRYLGRRRSKNGEKSEKIWLS